MTADTRAMDWITAALATVPLVQGRVYRGRSDDLGDSQDDDLPAIVVRTTSEAARVASTRTLHTVRSIEVRGVLRVPAAEYEPDMDALLREMYHALLPLWDPESPPAGTSELSITGVEYLHPASGSEIASVLINLNVSYVLTRQEGT